MVGHPAVPEPGCGTPRGPPAPSELLERPDSMLVGHRGVDVLQQRQALQQVGQTRWHMPVEQRRPQVEEPLVEGQDAAVVDVVAPREERLTAQVVKPEEASVHQGLQRGLHAAGAPLQDPGHVGLGR